MYYLRPVNDHVGHIDASKVSNMYLMAPLDTSASFSSAVAPPQVAKPKAPTAPAAAAPAAAAKDEKQKAKETPKAAAPAAAAPAAGKEDKRKGKAPAAAAPAVAASNAADDGWPHSLTHSHFLFFLSFTALFSPHRASLVQGGLAHWSRSVG